MAKVRTRQNALALSTWDPTILWYAKAVAEMKSRPANDPTSWTYQAAIHGYSLGTEGGSTFGVNHWTKWTKGQTLPAQKEQQAYWAQCQHGTWYFLPWHRMYLGFFEQIVSAIIKQKGGPADWALPYWNYNNGPQSGKLPQAFTEKNLPDGSPNPLFDPERHPKANSGTPFLHATHVDLGYAFGEHDFSGTAMTLTFGGPITVFEHGGDTHGALETLPHDQVHVDVGGLMRDPETAGFDPIFWLHHANIDRLWQLWLTTDPRNQNPTDTKWKSYGFNFQNGMGGTATMRPADVLDTTASPFYYTYAELALPAGMTQAPAIATAAVAQPKEGMTEQPVPEMIGASDQPTPLDAAAKTMRMRLFPVAGPTARMLDEKDPHFRKAYLHVEHVRGKGHPASYAVYLNAPEGKGEPDESFQVGLIPPFGLEQASSARGRHAGNGLHFAFNVTKVVNTLKAQNNWNPAELRVTFVPHGEAEEGSSIEVGRISLYYA